MNATLIKAAPGGDFAEVSALRQGWEAELRALVSQKRAIRFDMYPLPGIPEDIRDELGRQGYADHVLESDRWQHFLVPGQP